MRALCEHLVQPTGLGCMNLSWAYGDPPSHKDKIRLLNEVPDLVYDNLDTANIYGEGGNEKLLGEAVMHRRNEFLLARGRSRRQGRAQVEAVINNPAVLLKAERKCMRDVNRQVAGS